MAGSGDIEGSGIFETLTTMATTMSDTLSAAYDTNALNTTTITNTTANRGM